MEETFEEVTVLDKPMLFTCARVDRSTVPKGMYLYEVRHDDEMRGDPCQIANWIVVNHWGTLISNEPIRLEKRPNTGNAFRDIDPEKDWNYEGVNSTLQEYMEKHPPKKEKRKEFER
ncbi:LPD28 domain-containing protein [Bittarella massiliensis (ex Durand et al. 2017)]|nr:MULTISPECIES: LPD28 domain-containing protein [Eubacteriales]